ncbi:type III secretion system export apparatus subunit SctU [Trinickia caryophylli]|uniref:Type III secretion protein U n=1 Tax=Trinickia caryophylli TaxID=28094 RepID=A0A1X7D784_TRICW|nr:type III secretion system export apparatus subunit SctU [Trinickia caryophylli]PMS12685.1 EscU/YscU/HrcU family type III secretion system export apparatus switch protein [Trinickia caryophylli]TRX15091.1 EscU/YscU/HrcU family type III secretion system export apparatus switch protein [Trinickia caryophylli]WQE14950.1 type III secretion system export apparatus subunit SctU [Trinickia caryophylli]SMF09671.1 type III secretion protein U [Trinickia caryophylli]GLU31321.1 EscU/YscU/HrcU family ty
MSDEKTEQPTDKKLKDARRDGETVKSADLSFAALLIAAALGFGLAGPAMGEHLRAIMHLALQVREANKPSFDLRRAMTEIAMQAAILSLPVFATLVVGIASVAAQVGFQVSFKPIEPKFSAINPGSGLKRMFSVRSFVDLAKMLVKAAIIAAALWKTLLALSPLIVGVAYEPLPDLIQISWSTLCRVFAVGGVIYLVLGVADYGVQHWLFIRDHRMSKEDVKRENKDSEGDPHLKGKRKEVAREIVQGNPEPKVAGAQAVIVNPTHYAVAVRYMPDEYDLPRVVAKGVDADALEIRRMAERHGVPIVGNPPLARTLYRVPLEEAIPESCFKAVAAVLAWVEDLAAQRNADAAGQPALSSALSSASSSALSSVPSRGLPS